MAVMAKEATQEQVLDAARSLGEDFSREDVAEKLGLDVAEMRPSWKALKEGGQLTKVKSEGDSRLFKITDQ